MKIYSDADTSVNFSSYKTFAWLPHKKNHNLKDNRLDNDIVDSRVIQLVNNELVMRGITLNIENPDILIDYDIMTEKKTDVQQEHVYRNNFNYGYYGGRYNLFRWNYGPTLWSYNMGYKTVKIPYIEGTVTIDIHDKSKDRVVWKGWAIGSVNDAESFESELPKDIHKIFKKYPVPILK